MARIRTIKPEFFRHEELFEAERASGLPLRIAYAGLWTVADREGRFRWKPRVLVLDVLPFDDVDFGEVLDALAAHGFVVKYQVGSDTFGCIPTFTEHQHVNVREPVSNLPSPDEAGARTCENIPARVEGKGREGKNTPPSQASGGAGSYSDDFEKVWDAYRPIAAKNATKADAARAFANLPKADREACLTGVQRYASWLSGERQKRPDTPAKHLATFIHKRGWEPFMDDGGGMPTGKPTIRLSEDDPLWPKVSARYLAKHGKPPPLDRDRGWRFPVADYPELSTPT